MLEKIAKKLDEAEQEYVEIRNELRLAKDRYELVKAKIRTQTRTKFASEGTKPTLQEIEDALLVEQSSKDTELGKAFIHYHTTLAKKEKQYQVKKAWERRYWDAKI